MNKQKILKRLDSLETLGNLVRQEATMLKHELRDVVSCNSPKRGGVLSEVEIIKLKAKAHRRMFGKHPE